MASRTIPLHGKQSGLSGSWISAILRSGRWVIETLVSAILLLFATLFFLWVNQKQREFDELENKPKEGR